jgi:hypothetical protein
MRFKVPARQPESFKGSALYLAGRIKGLSPDRVEFVETRNIHTDDPRAAAALMEATASKSVRCQQPAYHFMITFDPKDAEAGKVTPELKRQIAQQVIERMGLEEHQLLVYSHRDTDHPHLHFLVNRVHPEKHVAYDRHQDGKRLTGIVKELAQEHGLNILRNREYERQLGRDVVEDYGPAVSDTEYWQAKREEREAQLPFGKDAVGDLRRRLKDDFYRAQTWADLNYRLGQKGITLERKGQGLILTDGERYAKLSEMGKGLRFQTLEKRFGQRFDDFMADRAAEVARDARERGLDTRDLDPASRRTVEAMMEGDVDRSPEGTAVRRADEADMDYRYWQQVEAAYRSRQGAVRYAHQRERALENQEKRDQGWLARRERSFMEGLGKVYKDADKARSLWDALEGRLGVKEAEDAIKANPFLLGSVKGIRTGNIRTPEREQARRTFKYLMERRQKFRDARLRLDHTRSEIELARRKTKAVQREYELIQQVAGTPKELKERLLERIRARARALERLSERAFARARVADHRKQQLEKAWRQHQERKRELARKKELSRELGFEL